MRSFLILILTVVGFTGCASGPYDSRSFSERAEPQVRAAMQFSACPYGEESADITTRSEINISDSNNRPLQYYRDYSRNPFGTEQVYRQPRTIVEQSVGGKRVTKCKPKPMEQRQ